MSIFVRNNHCFTVSWQDKMNKTYIIGFSLFYLIGQGFLHGAKHRVYF